MLSERSSTILRSIVDTYIHSAHPVASQVVARSFQGALSSATIRNEMMRLEEEGYIAQPHTSSGRVPLDKAYRYYVEALMAPVEPARETKRQIRHQFYQAARDLEEWSHLAAAILAAELHNLAVVTTARLTQTRLLWLELRRMNEPLVLLIAGLDAARVRQQILSLESPLGQEELTSLAQGLTIETTGMTAATITDRIETVAAVEQKPGLQTSEQQILGATARLMEAEDSADYAFAVLEGLRDMLQQPEFEDNQKIIELLDTFAESNLGRVLPFRDLPQGAVTIVIGGEHPQSEMREFSVVLMPYGGLGGLSGAVSVVGPTRLDYSGAAAMVRYMAGVMDELIATHFA